MAAQSRQRSGDGGPPATSAWTVPLYTTAAQQASSLLSSASRDREQQQLLHRPGSSSQTSNPVMLGTDQMASSSSSSGDDSDSGCDEGDRQGLLRIDALESSILANYPVADCTDDTGTGGGILSHIYRNFFVLFLFSSPNFVPVLLVVLIPVQCGLSCCIDIDFDSRLIAGLMSIFLSCATEGAS